MDRKKVIIAIILFVFLGLTVFTFANPDDEVSQLNEDTSGDVTPSGNDTDNDNLTDDTIATNDDNNDSTRGNLTITQSDGSASSTVSDVESDNDTEESATPSPTTPGTSGISTDSNTDDNSGAGSDSGESADTEDYKELIALVDELIKKVNDATALSELTDAREFNVEEEVVNSVSKVTDSDVKKTLEEKLASVLSILNDTKDPEVLVNGEVVKAVYNGNVDITVKDATATKTKSIKHNGEEIDTIDELVDGNYEITIIDAAYNETTIKFAYDATAPKATRVEILNNTHYDSKENINVINKGETLRVMVWFDEDLKDSAKLTIDGDRTVKLRKSGALTDESKGEYVYYYDYIIRQDLAQGEIKFVVNEYTDTLGNIGENITAIKNSNYGNVIYDSVAPTFKFENTNGAPVASRTVKLVASETIQALDGWAEVEGSNGKEWTRTFTSNKKIRNIIVTDLAGNVSDAKLLDVKGVDSSIPTGTLSYSTVTPTNEDVVVTLTTSTDCLTPEGWTKVNWRKFTKVYAENASEKVSLTSRTGIESDTDIPVEVGNIDRDPATVTYRVHGNQVRIYANEEISLNVSGWTNKNAGKEWRKSLTAGREYTLVATDLAGNTTEVVIDRVLPIATIRYDVTTLTNGDVTATMVTTEEIETPSGWMKVDATTYTKVYVGNVDETITITDLVGNSNTVDVLITNIDKDPAVLSYSIHGTHAWIKSNEEITIPGSTRHEDKNGNVDWRIKLAAGKEYILVATDLAGNPTSIVVDRVLPTVAKEIKKYEEKDGSRIRAYVEFSEPVKVNGGTEFVTTYTKLSYRKDITLNLVDNVGNVNTYIVDIDLVKPTATVSYDVTNSTTDSVTATMSTSEEIQTPSGWTKVDATTYTKIYKENVDENVKIVDLIGNHNLVNVKIDNILEITSSKTASNYIDTVANTIYNFNSFAIKFNRDITIKKDSSDQGFKIEMEYSTDGVNYTKSTGYIIDNTWTNTLMKNAYEKYTGDEFTVAASSPILWSGTRVGSRWTDIYDAILATKDTENKVYVRTIFTVIQPNYEKSFTLDPVVYSQGGAVATPNGTAVFE